MKERNIGVDIYRILCCIGVLTYHIIDDILYKGGVLAKVLYYGASYCVLGFFLLGGYLISKKRELSIDYCEKKVCKLIIKLFGWIIFWSLVHFMRTGEILNIWNQFLLGVGSGGVLPVAWFLFSYAVLIIFSYPLYRCLDKKYGQYVLIFIDFLLLIFLAFDFGQVWVKTKIQALWFHLYFVYFLSGMIIARIQNKISDKLKKGAFIIAVVAWIVSTLIYWLKINKFGGAPHQHYGKGYYSVWIISFFIVVLSCTKMNIPEKIKKPLSLCANNTFTVYLGHFPLLLYITEYRPFSGVGEAVVIISLLFIGLILLAELFKRIPLLRRIV